MDDPIHIEEVDPKILVKNYLHNCVDEEVYRMHFSDYESSECASNFLIHVKQNNSRASLKFKSSRKILFENKETTQLKLQPGFTHLTWCKPELSKNGLDVYISHKPRDRCSELFNDIIILPPLGQSILTINLRSWAQNIESEFKEGDFTAKPNPISPPYVGIRYSTDRLNFLLTRHEVLCKERTALTDKFAKCTKRFQTYIPILDTYRRGWFSTHLPELESVRHLQLTRGPKQHRTGSFVLRAQEGGIPGS